MSKFLPFVGVGYMHFHDGGFNSLDSITQSYGSMRITGGVKNDSIMGESYLLYLVNKFTFNVRLVIFELQFFKSKL